MRRLLLGSILGCLVCLVGCGKPANTPSLYEVGGKVSFDGLPVAVGEILFVPVDGKGRSDAGKIVDGAYACQITAGPKTVQITATRESPEKAPDGLPNYVSYIPAKYNSASTLSADVKSSGKNDFPFDLISK